MDIFQESSLLKKKLSDLLSEVSPGFSFFKQSEELKKVHQDVCIVVMCIINYKWLIFKKLVSHRQKIKTNIIVPAECKLYHF